MSVEIFSTDTDSGLVSVLRRESDGSHTPITQIRVGNAPRGGVKFTKDGWGYVSNTSGSTISEIDAFTHEEIGRIQVGAGPRGIGIVPGDRYALVSNSGSDTVSIVDLTERRTIGEVPVGRDPRHMGITADGQFAYVCIWGSGYIAKLDLRPLAENDPAGVREIRQITIGENTHPYSLNIDTERSLVLVATTHAPFMPAINMKSDEIIAKVDVGNSGGRAVAFSKDKRYALLSIERESTVAVVDLDTFRLTRKIPVGPGPRGLAVDATDNTLYISNFQRAVPMMKGSPDYAGNSLTVVNLDSASLASDDGSFRHEEVLVGYGPCSVVVFHPNQTAASRRERRAEVVTA